MDVLASCLSKKNSLIKIEDCLMLQINYSFSRENWHVNILYRPDYSILYFRYSASGWYQFELILPLME